MVAMQAAKSLGAILAVVLGPIVMGHGASAQAQPAGLTAVAGLKVGHVQVAGRPTGCTVVLAEGGAVGGVDVRGSAPGTRETDLLNPINTVEKVHAVVLSGGSAFGLDTASGVMRYLDEHEIGFATGFGKVPIVPAAVLFDLNVGDPKIRPTADCGYRASVAASSGVVAEGNVGAGSGATVGKPAGAARAMRCVWARRARRGRPRRPIAGVTLTAAAETPFMRPIVRAPFLSPRSDWGRRQFV
jgi:L-aminopeptidase/D-esterase-like protein